MFRLAHPQRRRRHRRRGRHASVAPAPTCRGCPTTTWSPGWPRPTTTLVQLAARARRTGGRMSSTRMTGSWLGPATRSRTLLGVPLVATIHATERGPSRRALPPGMPAAINAVEWWLTYQAATRSICCSKFMVREVVDGFELPAEKVHLVPERRRPRRCGRAASTRPSASPRRRRGAACSTRRASRCWSGRSALCGSACPGIRCVIAGRGSYLARAADADRHRGRHRPRAPRRLRARRRPARMLHRAGCVVIPSLYEPFGIVALEAMAAGAPTVVARTGGLAEIVEGTGAGLLFDPGNPDELAIASRSAHRRRSRREAAARPRRCWPSATRGRRSPTTRSAIYRLGRLRVAGAVGPSSGFTRAFSTASRAPLPSPGVCAPSANSTSTPPSPSRLAALPGWPPTCTGCGTRDPALFAGSDPRLGGERPRPAADAANASAPSAGPSSPPTRRRRRRPRRAGRLDEALTSPRWFDGRAGRRRCATSPTSRPSSASPRRCPSTPAASASWPATT